MSKEKRNSFTRKMEVKSTEELRDILKSKDYAHGAKLAAKWELEAREQDGTLELDNEKRMEIKLGESRYDDFVKTIKKNKKYTPFGTPHYSESLDNELSTEAKFVVITKALEKLKWPVVYDSEHQIVAIREDSMGNGTEELRIGFGPTNLLVRSESRGSGKMDFGRNSVRVKLFFHVFLETIEELGEETLHELEQKLIRSRSWLDYEVPERLPDMPDYKPEQPALFYVGTGAAGILLGLLLGVGMSIFHIIIAYEAGVAWLLALAMGRLMTMANYAHIKKTRQALVLATAIIIISAQVGGYFHFLNQNPVFYSIGFFDYLELKFQSGVVFDNLELGSWVWLVIFVLQAFIIFNIGLLRIIGPLTHFQIDRIPGAVIEYIRYLKFKKHDKDGMRKELATKGWNDARAQDYVFDAMFAIEYDDFYARE